jgi:hypothetical protein
MELMSINCTNPCFSAPSGAGEHKNTDYFERKRIMEKFKNNYIVTFRWLVFLKEFFRNFLFPFCLLFSFVFEKRNVFRRKWLVSKLNVLFFFYPGCSAVMGLLYWFFYFSGKTKEDFNITEVGYFVPVHCASYVFLGYFRFPL